MHCYPTTGTADTASSGGGNGPAPLLLNGHLWQCLAAHTLCRVFLQGIVR